MKASLLAVALAALLATAILLHHGVASETTGIRLGIELNTHATAAWVALDKDLFNKNGLRVEKTVKFRTGLELAAAFAKGEIDVAWACLAPLVKMIDKGANIYIVQATHYYGYGCVGRPGIESIDDLRGLAEPVVAVTGNGAQTHVLLLLVEKRYGFHAKIVFMKPPAILSAVLTGSVDAACMPEPYVSIAEAKGLHVLLIAQDLWPGMPGSYLAVSAKYLEKHPEVVCKLARINSEATSWAVNHLDEAAIIDSKYLGIPPRIAKTSLTRLQLTTSIDAEEMQKLVNIMYKYGLIKHRISIASRLVDLEKLCSEKRG